MSVTLEELGKRAIACKNWKWLPGMLAWRITNSGNRVRVRFLDEVSSYGELAEASQIGPLVASGHAIVDGWHKSSDLVPDLSDPATLGCLLQLVREVRSNPTGFLTPSAKGGWTYFTQLYQADYFLGDTEAEALLAALEAAP